MTVSIPYHGAAGYVRRAVESILQQSFSNLKVVVVSDGDPNAPWDELAHLNDTRLIRFSLTQSRGPYFVHHIVLGASDTPFLMVQDADDWSDPDRLRKLLDRSISEGSDLTFSSWRQYRVAENGGLLPIGIRWRRTAVQNETNGDCVFDPVLNGRFINRASHHGVFRRTALESIGGYYAGFRMNYDTLLTNFLLMTGKVSFVEEPLYHYTIRRDSLSHSAATGVRSRARIMAKAQQEALYQRALGFHQQWLRQEINSSELTSRIRRLVTARISQAEKEAIQYEIRRLAVLLRN